MSTVVTERQDPGAARAVPYESAAARERAASDAVGTVTISDTVVAKLAAHAALEVPEAGGASPRVLGRVLPGASRIRASSLENLPQASADVDGSVAYIELTISVLWPASIAKVTAEVRDRVIARVAELTDLTVSQVRITVTALVAATPAARVQ